MHERAAHLLDGCVLGAGDARHFIFVIILILIILLIIILVIIILHCMFSGLIII